MRAGTVHLRFFGLFFVFFWWLFLSSSFLCGFAALRLCVRFLLAVPDCCPLMSRSNLVPQSNRRNNLHGITPGPQPALELRVDRDLQFEFHMLSSRVRIDCDECQVRSAATLAAQPLNRSTISSGAVPIKTPIESSKASFTCRTGC